MLWSVRPLVIHSYSNLADWILIFLLSFFTTFSTDCSFLAMAFATDFFLRTFFVLFIGLPFFTFLVQETKGMLTWRRWVVFKPQRALQRSTYNSRKRRNRLGERYLKFFKNANFNLSIQYPGIKRGNLCRTQ